MAYVEGATQLDVPATNQGIGPGRREKGQPFYNPGMALNRDLSVLLAQAEQRRIGREIDIADALAGTGARSLRLAHEVEGPVIVHANDADPKATVRRAQAAVTNAIPEGRLRSHESDAHAFLASQRFDIVDLDPCGSPMPFLDAAIRATRHAGLVCVTATDTGALSGAFPRVCRRRYDAEHHLEGPWHAEVGLRILAGAIVRSAARFERTAVPVLSVSRGHWMRVVARLGEGRQATDAGLSGLGYGVPTPTGSLAFVERPPERPFAGPLWTGPLHDPSFVAGMAAARPGKALARPDEVDVLLAHAAQECDAPPFWIVPDLLQSALGPPPRRDVLMGRLQAAGFAAARTHLDPQGIRTDAGLEDLRRLWRAAEPTGAPKPT